MIRKLDVEGVTVFPQEVSFDFVPGINVIVGGNDSGKSHLMKLCYALGRWGEKSIRRDFPEAWAEERRLHHHLTRTFGIHEIGSLVSRGGGVSEARVHASLQGEKAPIGSAELELRFAATQGEQLRITTMPQRFLQENALFIPPREALSLFPYYMQVGKRYPDMPDALSWDLCSALEGTADTPPGADMLRVQRYLEGMLHGRLVRQNSRFVLQRGKEAPMELSLVAEGFKRLGTVGLLAGNGMLRPGSTLYWDEPEMNLNTAQLPELCQAVLLLCSAGVQLIITTHSLFLLRELVIRLGQPEWRGLSRRFIGLQATKSARGTSVHVSAGDTPDEIGPLASLEAEMAQADRYLRMPNHTSS